MTPTYNRKAKLNELYLSLINQTNKDFIWLIIDDGSTDGTEEKVEYYKKQHLLNIEYIYKPNHGKHTALNIAFEVVNTELLFIVDSDDTLTEEAVEIIYSDYQLIQDNNYCALVYLRGNNVNKPLGDFFRKEGRSNYIDVQYKHKHKADKAEVWKTKCLNNYRFPVYENETFIGEAYIWAQIGEHFDYYLRNEVIYICEYLDEGLTRSGRSFRMKNPYGGMAHAKIHMRSSYPVLVRVKNNLLFVVYGLCANLSFSQILDFSCDRKTTQSMFLFGLILYKIWRLRYK